MSLIIFDVNETLSDLAPMGARFAEVGAEPELATTWYAGTLRDGIALSLVGTARAYADVARGVLGTFRAQFDRDLDAVVDHVLSAFTSLDLHPDAAAAIPALAAAGHTVATLSNGAASVAEGLFERAGIREHVHAVLSVEDAPGGAWKPAAAAYRYALDVCEAEPAEAVLVAVHPWDVHGAATVGLRTAYVDRVGNTPWPAVFARPDFVVAGIDDLAALL